MAKLEPITIWIFNYKKDGKNLLPRYILGQNKPCDSPKEGYIHLIIDPDSDGSKIARIVAKHVLDETITTKIGHQELNDFQASFCGDLGFIDRVSGIVDTLSDKSCKDLLDCHPDYCFGSQKNNLIHIFTVQFALLAVLLTWLKTPLFWQKKLLPLYADVSVGKIPITQHILRRLAFYIAYLSATGLTFDLNPILESAAFFITNFSHIFEPGEKGDEELYLSELNLALIRFVLFKGHEEPLSTRDIERATHQATRSIAGNVSALSEQVVVSSLKEIRKRLDGCVEECVRGAYPKIKSYLDTATETKKESLSILKSSLEEEIKRNRKLTEESFNLIEKVKHLEQKVKILEANRKENEELNRKVEHLQSVINQIIKNRKI